VDADNTTEDAPSRPDIFGPDNARCVVGECLFHEPDYGFGIHFAGHRAVAVALF